MDIKRKNVTKRKKLAKFALASVSVLFVLFLLISYQNCSSSFSVDFSSINPCPIPHETQENFCTEIFYLSNSTKRVDVLFVIDNSGSMAEEQAELGKRFDSLLGHIQSLDYHIGIISTDVPAGQGKLLSYKTNTNQDTGIRILKPSTSNKKELFLTTVQMGAYGSNDERPFHALKLAIEHKDDHNAGFFRDGVELSVVVVTDENVGAAREDFVVKFQETWGTNKTLFLHGIIGSNEGSQCGAYNGTIIREMIHSTGGLEGNICSNDYGGILSDIGSFIASLFKLSIPPVAEEIVVKINRNGTLIDLDESDYDLDGSVLRVNGTKPGDKIIVDYQYK